MGNEAWILEDSPPRLNSEELNAFRSELSALSIQCSDGNVSCQLWNKFNSHTSFFCLFNIMSMLKKIELVLDLNAIEADAMEDSDEIQDI